MRSASPFPPEPPKFQPAKLSRRDLEVTVGKSMRQMPADTIEDMQQTKRDMHDRFRVHTPGFERRLKHYVIGSAIAFPLVTGIFTPAGFGNLVVQILLSGVFGAVLAYVRPTGLAAGLLAVVFGMGILFICGPSQVTYLALICTVLFYLVVGFAIGTQEHLQSMDGS